MENWKRVSSTAERLKEALVKSNMKQADLSRATGLDKGSIHHYLTGKYEPKSRAIKKMASALGVDEMWLWGYDVPMEPGKNINSSAELQLSEGEKTMLDLFNQIPEDKQRIVIEMIRAALNTQKE